MTDLNVVRVDMTQSTCSIDDLPDEWAERGGRSFTSHVVAEEVNPTCDPFSADNKLVFGVGLLVGTPAPSCARLSVGGKSPLTGGIKEANCGGRAAAFLARLGIRGIIIEGRSDESKLLLVRDGNVELAPGAEYAGMGNYELVGKLKEQYGDNVSVLSVGPAGEMGLKAATVATTDMDGLPTRHAARGGLGAVMGAKGLKAVVIFPLRDSRVTFRDLDAFRSITKPWGRELAEAKEAFSKMGTAINLDVVNEVRGLPTKNYRMGQFEGALKINADSLDQMIRERGGQKRVACCPGCVIRCSNVFVAEDGSHVTSSLEYETIVMNGSNLMIDDLDAIAEIDRLCDDIGLDTMEMGAAFGVAMEGGLLEWGDATAVHSLLEEIRQGADRGRMLGNGAAEVGRRLGVARVPTVKGQGLPAYDPRILKGMGATYCTTPMGADHTAGPCIVGRKAYPDKDYGELSESEHKALLSYELQVFVAMMDSAGFCFFVGPDCESAKKIAALLNARYGWTWQVDDVMEMAKDVLRTEREFNRRAGFTPDDDRLPQFFYDEALPPSGRRFDIPQEDFDEVWQDLTRDG